MSEQNPSVKNPNLKYYQWLAFGALGLYIWKSAQAQNKSLLGGDPVELGKFKVQMNPDRMVESVAPWIDIPADQRAMVVVALKEFLRGLKNG